MGQFLNAMVSEIQDNDLKSFKSFLENSEPIKKNTSNITYEYGTTLLVYNENAVGGTLQVNPSTVIDTMTNTSMMSDMNSMASMSSFGGMSDMMNFYNMNAFFELNREEGEGYRLVTGHFPQSKEEVLLVVGDHYDLSDLALYTLGLRDQSEVSGQFADLMAGKATQSGEEVSFSFDELMAMEFKLVLPGNMYQDAGNGIYTYVGSDEEKLQQVLDDGLTLRIAGIARPSNNSLVSAFAAGGVGYTHELVEYVIDANN